MNAPGHRSDADGRAAQAGRPVLRRDAVGGVLGLLSVGALVGLPLAVFKASRIATGDYRGIFDALPHGQAGLVIALGALLAAVCAARVPTRWRLAAALAGCLVVAVATGHSADYLTPVGDRIVRIAPGPGAWAAWIAFALVATNELARLTPGPVARVAWLGATLGVVALLFHGGVFDNLSVMREYGVNAGSFGREVQRHVALALGSLAGALLVGLPLGVACHLVPRLRRPVLRSLNLVQTVPSIALFGILMVPLAALSTAYPAIGALGIHGIGAAPAAIALFLYALLPVVGNTVAGLARVSPAVVESARGMGLTPAQVLWQVEIPLSLPVILAGVRIVLVQNIGLATIAALIGGGGLGTFVFQGVGQTAIDLVLLGAIPTVVLAFSCSVLLNAAADLTRRSSI